MRKALFKNGDVVKYNGSRHVEETINGISIPVLFNGMEATVIDTKQPRKGDGIIGQDEEGESIIDYDEDGYNVFENAGGNRRIIWPKDSKDWEKI